MGIDVTKALGCAALWLGLAASAAAQLGGPLPGSASSVSAAGPVAAAPLTPNVLLVILDDVGNDKVGAYGEHPQAPPTPTLDALAARGVLFRNAYANPVCSPTRATIMTGRYSFRTGIGAVIKVKQPVAALPYAELTLPELFELGAPGRYENALVGKWHLGSASSGAEFNALQQGWQHHWGVKGNLGNYYSWPKFEDGVPVHSTEYVTSVQIDDALHFTRQLREPWLIALSTTAAHTPYHAPPANLHSERLSGAPADTPVAHFDAAVEALDTELGRLFDAMDPAVLARTTVIVIGDNGPPGAAVTPPFASGGAKGSLYEGAVNVPLIVAGWGVPAQGAECRALVSSVDLFATVAELGGLDARAVLPDYRALDSISLVPYFSEPGRTPLRAYAYVEKFSPNGVFPAQSAGRAIRDVRWKLIQRQGSSEQFYDLGNAITEGVNLLGGSDPLSPDQLQGYLSLKLRLEKLTGSP